MKCHTEDEFKSFLLQLKETNATLNFFCDFNKISDNVSNIELKLNQLNYLLGKDDLNHCIKLLWEENKNVFDVLEILIAVRKSDNKKVISDNNEVVRISNFYKSVDGVIKFIHETGLDEVFKNRKIKNLVDPPPNISCRYFTYSTEFIIWARRDAKKPHYFNYELMKSLNDNKQMTDVWRLPAVAKWEKSCGKHPTQKPLSLLIRIILASTKPNAWILDPFSGSSTTGIAANLINRNFLGIEQDCDFVEMSRSRRIELEDKEKYAEYRSRLKDIVFYDSRHFSCEVCEDKTEYNLPF